MNLAQTFASAAAIGISAAAAILSVAGMGGWRNGWLDIINHFAPVVLLLALCGGVFAVAGMNPGLLRSETLGMAFVAAALSSALVVPELMKATPIRRGRGRALRILSANVWFSNPTPAEAVSAILARDADIVFLQESNGSLRGELYRLRLQYPFGSECPDSGERIFVKSPILAQGCGLGSPAGDLVWVQIAMADGRPVTLVTAHFSKPFPPAEQQAEREALAAKIRSLPNDDLILTGDFNTTPWSFAMRRQDRSLMPLQRRTIAWSTWPARLVKSGWLWPVPFLPIDHIYSSPRWGKARLSRLRVPGSDHFATEAVLIPHIPAEPRRSATEG